MTLQGNIPVAAGAVDPADISIGMLLQAIAATPDLPMVFFSDGRAVQPGYHITEVKTGAFAGLDCGGNPESWTEIFVQLWDVNEDAGRSHMTAGKVGKIIGKVIDHVRLDPAARLTFELSDGVAPMQLHRAALPVVTGGVIRIDLSPRPASCKPRDRWLKEQAACAPADGCCG